MVCIQNKQEETTVGQAGPLSLFGEGIRPSGLVGPSASEVGGCRPIRDGLKLGLGGHMAPGASLWGRYKDGLLRPVLALMIVWKHMPHHPWEPLSTVSPCPSWKLLLGTRLPMSALGVSPGLMRVGPGHHGGKSTPASPGPHRQVSREKGRSAEGSEHPQPEAALLAQRQVAVIYSCGYM